MALLKDCPVRTDWLGVLLLLSVIFLVLLTIMSLSLSLLLIHALNGVALMMLLVSS